MNTPTEQYQWLPADERLANAIFHGATVFVKNAEGDTGTIDKAVVKELCEYPNLTAINALQILVQNKIKYLPPTAPEVKDLPDCEGWWWVWDDNRKSWDRLYVEMKDGKPHHIGKLVRKSYCIKMQKPNFNPTTGEKL